MSLYSKVIGLEDRLYLLKNKIEKLNLEDIEKLKETQEIQSQWLGNYGEQPFYKQYQTTIADNIFQVWGYNNAKNSSWLLYDRQKLIGSWAYDAKKKSEANESSLDYIRIDVRDIKNSDIPALQSKTDANYNNITSLRQKTIGNAILPNDYNMYNDLNIEKSKLEVVKTDLEQKTLNNFDAIDDLKKQLTVVNSKLDNIESTINNLPKFFKTEGWQEFSSVTGCSTNYNKEWFNCINVQTSNNYASLFCISFNRQYLYPVAKTTGQSYSPDGKSTYIMNYDSNARFMRYDKTTNTNLQMRQCHPFQETIYDNWGQYHIIWQGTGDAKEGYNIYMDVNNKKIIGYEKGIIANSNIKKEVSMELYNNMDRKHPIIINDKKVYKMIPTKNFDHAISPFLKYTHVEKDIGKVIFKAMQPKLLTKIGLSKKHILKEYTEQIKFDRKFIGYIE